MVSCSSLVGGLDFCFCFCFLMPQLNLVALLLPLVSTSHRTTLPVLACEHWATTWLREMGKPPDFFLPLEREGPLVDCSKIVPGWQGLRLASWASAIAVRSFCTLLFYIFSHCYNSSQPLFLFPTLIYSELPIFQVFS